MDDDLDPGTIESDDEVAEEEEEEVDEQDDEEAAGFFGGSSEVREHALMVRSRAEGLCGGSFL